MFGLLCIQRVRYSWVWGQADAYELSDNFLIFVLLLMAATPWLSTKWSVKSIWSKQQQDSETVPAMLQVSIIAILGIGYFFSSLWKVWTYGMDWCFDERVTMSFVALHSTCGSLGRSPPVNLHLLPGSAWILRAGALGAILFEAGVLPALLLFGFTSQRRSLICLTAVIFHTGIRETMNLDFWSLKLCWLWMTEWADLWQTREKNSDAGHGDCGAGNTAHLDQAKATIRPSCEEKVTRMTHRCTQVHTGLHTHTSKHRFLSIICTLVFGYIGYKGYLDDNNHDLPFSSFPPFQKPISHYLDISVVSPCPTPLSLWTLHIDFEPEIGGRRTVRLLEDLVPHHMTTYMNYANLIERALLRGTDPQKMLRALRVLLHMVRLRIDPRWNGTAVSVVTHARLYSRKTGEMTDKGDVLTYPFQQFTVRAREGSLFSSSSLFSEADGHTDRELHETMPDWEVFVCEQPLQTLPPEYLEGTQILPATKLAGPVPRLLFDCR
eukprot:TRINITY_DN39930_c0_g1_i1.p1 TRINITY_DN39930_c0_g1~~TRINITY_DN39930_c0_g1_i1.p1  ORF type:complete len:545 (+),score=30.30 TRINITY_DN39930_c0_g1_i1:158-1636(+)